jgi:hypothetical protein
MLKPAFGVVTIAVLLKTSESDACRMNTRQKWLALKDSFILSVPQYSDQNVK